MYRKSLLIVCIWLLCTRVCAEAPSVEVNRALGTIVVRAYPEAMRNVDKLIRQLKEKYNKQVIIEAKFIEVKLSKDNEFGLDLNLPRLNIAAGGSIRYFKDNATKANYNEANSDTDTFTVFLNHLARQGKVSVLSSPRIVTINAQKAIMKVGEEKYFALDTTTTLSGNNDNFTSSSINTKAFFSGIALDVTPEYSLREY